MSLTKKQKSVYDFIRKYCEKNSFAPTQEEIRQFFGLKSLGSVQDYLRYLTQSGFIRTDANAVRGIEVLFPEQKKYSSSSCEIPLLGKVAAGQPLESFKHDEMVTIPADLLTKGASLFALKVQGTSMIEDGIFDGDTVVIKKQNTANNGETVVAVIDDEATIKKYFRKKNQVELHPANSQLRPLILKEGNLEIKGILVGLIRTY